MEGAVHFGFRAVWYCPALVGNDSGVKTEVGKGTNHKAFRSVVSLDALADLVLMDVNGEAKSEARDTKDAVD